MQTNPEEEARRIVEEGQRAFQADVGSASSTVQTLASRMGTASQDIADGNRATERAIAEAEAGFRSLGQSAVSFSRSLTSNDSSVAKYNGAIDAAGTGLAMLASAALGPFGVVLGLLVKAFTSLVGAELNQADKILTNFSKLGDMGAAAQFTASELDGMFNSAGFSTFNGQSQMMVKTIEGLGTTLTQLGKTSGDGIKTFTQLASFNNANSDEQQKIRNQFNNLGISQEKLLNSQAAFMKEQGAMGFGRRQVDKKLVDQSLDYTKNLSALSAITGASTDAHKASRAKDLEDFGFNVALRQEGIGEEADKRRDFIQKTATSVGSLVDDAAKKGFMSVYANGNATTQEAIAMQQRTGGEFVNWVKAVKNGSMKQEEFINLLNKATSNNLDTMGAAMKNSQALRDMYATGTKTVTNSSRVMAEGTLDAVANALTENMNKGDIYTNVQNEMKNATDNLAKMFDQLLKLIQPMLIDAFKYLMDSVKSLAIGFMQSRLAKMLGLDFTPILMNSKTSNELNVEVLAYLKLLHDEKANKEKLTGGSVGNTVNKLLHGQVDVRGIDERIKDIEKQLKVRQDELINRRGVDPYNEVWDPAADKKKKEKDPKYKAEKPLVPAPYIKDAPTISAPQFKFGGVTGIGDSSDLTSKLTGSGIFDGPSSGYRKTLPKNKNFAVVPLPSGDTIPVTFKGGMDSQPSLPADLTKNKMSGANQITDMMSDLVDMFSKRDEEPETETFSSTNDTDNKSNMILESITGKLDTLVERLKMNNRYQSELLDFAKG
jgi:hypothetical protein